MKKAKAGRPFSTKASPRAEDQSLEAWCQRAAKEIHDAVKARGWSYPDFAKALKTYLGVEMSAPALNRRINRGNFTAGFFLMCKSILDDPSVAETARGRSARSAKKGLAAEDVMNSWGRGKSSV